MNTLAISPHLIMHFLQRQNVKHTLAPVLETKINTLPSIEYSQTIEEEIKNNKIE